MRILMLNNEFPPLGGGTGTVNRCLLERFVKVDSLEIDLVTSARGSAAEEEQLAEGIRLYKVPVNNRNLHHSTNHELVRYAIGALPLAARLHSERKFDLCFAWSGVPAGAMALCLRRWYGLPYLVRVCGPDIPGYEKRHRFIYPLLAPVIRWTWHGAEKVVVKCKAEQDRIRNLEPTTRLAVIPNGVDTEAFTPGPPVADHGPLRLIIVARLIEHKGHSTLFHAMHTLVQEECDIVLDVVGEGDAIRACKALVAKLELQEYVSFRGYVPREKIAACYREAEVFVLPSHGEGMSVSTLEAMAAGLPLVVTRTGGTDELVEEGVNGFTFAFGDVGALVGYLKRLAGDRSLVRRMGGASRTKAATFSWESAAQQYLALFRDVAL